MASRFGRFIFWAFIIALLLTIADTLFSYKNLTVLKNNNAKINKIFQVITELKDISFSIANAAIDQRNFFLTSNENYLTLYKNDLEIIHIHTAKLDGLMRDNTSQQKKLKDLEGKITDRISLLDKGIMLYKTQGFEAAQVLVAGGQGQKKMEEIKAISTDLEKEGNKLLQSQENQTTTGYHILYYDVLLAGSINFLLLIIIYYLIRRELRVRNFLEYTKDEFISIASHEFKTPITSLKMYTSLLKKEVAKYKNMKANEFTNKINSQSDKLVSLVAELLDITRIQTGKLRYDRMPIELNGLVEETVEALQETTKKHKIIIKGKLTSYVFADRFRIYQVFVNLINNSIKYSPKGGKIIVVLSQNKQQALISVKDYGIGIEKVHQKRIFEKLYQATQMKGKTTSGLGIGLYITSEIIKHHGGKIWVESQKGKGSTFYFTLPLIKKRT